MKALSLYPQNAAAVAWGEKLVEYRSWQTKYRGPVLICANARKTCGYLSGYGLCVMNLEGIYHFPDKTFGWRFRPFKRGSLTISSRYRLRAANDYSRFRII